MSPERPDISSAQMQLMMIEVDTVSHGVKAERYVTNDALAEMLGRSPPGDRHHKVSRKQAANTNGRCVNTNSA